MVEPLTEEQLKTMRVAGKAASDILKKIKTFIRPDITTRNIEEFFDNALSEYPGMEPAFKGFMGYKASCCVSINEEIIHGVPSERKIREGDLVSVDLGIKYKGLFVDTAYTFILPKASRQARRLVKVTLDSLHQGIKKVKPGAKVGDLGFAIQAFVEKNGYSVIRKFVGHGIGRQLHLPPEIPNFGQKGQGPELINGQVIAIEPMVSSGDFDIDILEDGWTAKTKDNSLSAHFEHTVAVTDKGPVIMTL
ncbi:MAG: type I methionyl aminopeptidase [Candidatus Omnitrophica bacterium]|nr:type I methionyl aminopeptidase [Candidatus Omnitrophota bacterium]